MSESTLECNLCRILETALGREGGALAIELVGPVADSDVWIKATAVRLRELQEMGVAFDLPQGQWQRLIRPIARPTAGQLASRHAILRALARVSPSPDYRMGMSLSHSGCYGVGAVRVRIELESRGRIGIDLEHRDRDVSSRLAQRIWHPGDSAPDLPPIGLWTAKEAVYKAVGVGSFASLRIELAQESEILWRGRGWAGDGAELDIALGLDLHSVIAVAIAP